MLIFSVVFHMTRIKEAKLKIYRGLDKSKCCAIMLLNTSFIHQSLRATIHIHLFPIFNHNGRDCSNFLLIWQFVMCVDEMKVSEL